MPFSSSIVRVGLFDERVKFILIPDRSLSEASDGEHVSFVDQY